MVPDLVDTVDDSKYRSVSGKIYAKRISCTLSIILGSISTSHSKTAKYLFD